MIKGIISLYLKQSSKIIFWGNLFIQLKLINLSKLEKTGKNIQSW